MAELQRQDVLLEKEIKRLKDAGLDGVLVRGLTEQLRAMRARQRNEQLASRFSVGFRGSESMGLPVPAEQVQVDQGTAAQAAPPGIELTTRKLEGAQPDAVQETSASRRVQRVRLIDGYLCDESEMDLPTYREMLDYDSLDNGQKRDALLELWERIYGDRFEAREPETGEEYASDDEALESFSRDYLDEQVDSEMLSPREAAMLSGYGAGIAIFEALPVNVAREIGLELVEGDHPGSDFCGVRFVGELTDLNRELERIGWEAVIEE